MDTLFRINPLQLTREGDIVEGKVIRIDKAELFCDLGFATGIVYGKEFREGKDVIRSLKEGDVVALKILSTENDEGYVELSIAGAGKDKFWQEAQEIRDQKNPLTLKALEANKGGLVLEWKGVKGFLPVSQLSQEHYPRVEGGDKNKILEELQKFVGKEFTCTILDANKEEGKLIFSERVKEPKEIQNKLKAYQVGQELEGAVSGIVDFGIFVKLEDDLEGLVHISELDWSLVESPGSLFTMGDKIKVKVIGIENSKISLSVKALKPDPWQKAKFQKGDIVEGKVTKLNKFGAFVQIIDKSSPEISGKLYGLSHVSGFGALQKMRETVQIGSVYPFQIAVFQPDLHKLSLIFLGNEAKETARKEAATTEISEQIVKKE